MIGDAQHARARVSAGEARVKRGRRSAKRVEPGAHKEGTKPGVIAAADCPPAAEALWNSVLESRPFIVKGEGDRPTRGVRGAERRAIILLVLTIAIQDMGDVGPPQAGQTNVFDHPTKRDQ